MEPNDKQDVDLNKDLDVNDDDQQDDFNNQNDGQKDDNNSDDDDTDWKAEALRLKGLNQRYKTKLDKFKLGEKPEAKPKGKESSELDYGQRAFLAANGIKDKDEVNLIKDFMQNTGKSLDDVLDSKYFQNELKELREEKTTKAAMPTGAKRSGQAASDEVDYWLAKGELPPIEQRELRIKVVNAKIAKEKSKGMFFDS